MELQQIFFDPEDRMKIISLINVQMNPVLALNLFQAKIIY
jgi:hypothetical protein